MICVNFLSIIAYWIKCDIAFIDRNRMTVSMTDLDFVYEWLYRPTKALCIKYSYFSIVKPYSHIWTTLNQQRQQQPSSNIPRISHGGPNFSDSIRCNKCTVGRSLALGKCSPLKLLGRFWELHVAMFLEPAFIKLPQGGCKLSVFVFLKRVNFTAFLLRTLVHDYRRLQTLPTTNDTCTKCLESNSKESVLIKLN